MSERRVIKAKRSEPSTAVQNREKTETEKRFAAHVQKMREEREQRKSGNGSELTPNPVGSEAETTNNLIPSQSKPMDELPMRSEQTLPPKRRPRFEEVHDRVTTYLSKENHQKIRQLKEEYGIPVSETINQALLEYFQRKTW
ncbi:hypothetical protein M4D70_25365 [Brevibacillus borstelensis]|uniref:hypothetical protein n=1 Tax=Brevibacillus borstelensis TaxID=45462 RepID=UPI00203B194D|nr:hypothetical protein [Brevibacillus borstelensis]MCM3625510.1 hypothetical protein [Brevibacillus borstelensis]